MKNQFITIFKEALEIENADLTIDTKFKELDEWDSIGLLSVIAAIDEEYEITLESKDLESVETLRELFALIQSKVD